MNNFKNKLLNVISETIANTLYEYENIEVDTTEYTIALYNNHNCDDYEYIKNHKDYIYDFLNKGYEYANLGHFCGCTSANSLLKIFNVIKIAHVNNEIIAISVYTGYQDGKKCVGITATTNEEYRELGKKAVMSIIKNDIDFINDFYWIECSGAVEHMYKRYGGVMIPNDYIEQFIGNKFESKSDDRYHFSVRYKSTSDEDQEDNIINKVIFGFNNKRTYEIVKEKLNEDLVKRLDYIMNSIDESDLSVKRDKYQAAHDIIYVFYDEKCEGVNEFDEKFLNILENSVKTLEDYIIKNPNDKRTEKFKTAIWNAHDILDSSVALELHKI